MFFPFVLKKYLGRPLIYCGVQSKLGSGQGTSLEKIDLNGNEVKAIGIYINESIPWGKQPECTLGKGKNIVSIQ